MAQYYKMIKGKKYDRGLLGLADRVTRGRGDGRISLADARALVRRVKDSGEYTDIEKRTMAYIRDHYSFTPEADRWFRAQIRSWAATRAGRGAGRAVPARGAKKPAARRAVQSFPPQEMLHGAGEEEDAPYRPVRPERKKSGGLWKILLLLILVAAVILAIAMLPRIRECVQRGVDSCPFRGAPAAPEKKEETAAVTGRADETAVPRPPAEEKAPPPVPEDEGSYYMVEVKDSLIGIAEKLTGDYRDWVKLYEVNRDRVKNPLLIFPRHRLRIPEEMKGRIRR